MSRPGTILGGGPGRGRRARVTTTTKGEGAGSIARRPSALSRGEVPGTSGGVPEAGA